jgi:hypothetical protein
MTISMTDSWRQSLLEREKLVTKGSWACVMTVTFLRQHNPVAAARGTTTTPLLTLKPANNDKRPT